MDTKTKETNGTPLNGSAEGPAYRKGIEAIRLSHQQNVSDEIARQSRHNESLRQAVNAESIPGLEPGKGEDVGSNLAIDSPTTTTIHNHYGNSGSNEERPKKSKLGTIAKLAIGAGLMATGAGGTIGAGIILDAIKNRDKTPPAIEKPAPETPKPGRERKYSLDLGD